MEHVDRARLVVSCGSCDDSLGWNLSHAKQGETILVDNVRSHGQEQKKAGEAKSCLTLVSKLVTDVDVRKTQEVKVDS